MRRQYDIYAKYPANYATAGFRPWLSCIIQCEILAVGSDFEDERTQRQNRGGKGGGRKT